MTAPSPAVRCLVLRSGAELRDAERRAQAMGLARPPSAPKVWDNLLAVEHLADVIDEPIVDLGCRSGIVLTWLHQRGARRLHGCDLRAPWPPVLGAIRQRRVRDALVSASMYLRNARRMRRAPIERTGFPDDRFAAATSMSVIEHGVDLPAFFREAHRIVRPGGRLVVSTDYWPEPVDARTSAWNERPDRVFDRDGALELLALAAEAGWSVPDPDLDAQERLVHWRGRSYTFLVLVLAKPTAASVS